MNGQGQTVSGPDDLEGRLQELLTVAAFLRFLARGFAYPHPGHLAQLLADFDTIPRAPTPASTALRAIWDQVDEAAFQEEHVRLFLGKGVCSLHETSYGDARRIGGQPVELADISGFYRAFGVEPSPTQPDLPDHLCTELEFYSLLLVKEAYACNEGWSEQQQIAADAGVKFLEHHLGRWIEPMVQGLREHAAPATPYGALAEVLLEAIQQECMRRQVVPQPFSGRVPADESILGDSFVCPRDGMPDAAPS
ncbi:MAG: molecular chaperone TorD family protein [Magnetococcales bacterium]|nr:molecular chaperone TorD family protein [Magnetococcales bacterium]